MSNSTVIKHDVTTTTTRRNSKIVHSRRRVKNFSERKKNNKIISNGMFGIVITLFYDFSF